MSQNNDWWIFKGKREPHDGIQNLPDAPPWRGFTEQAEDLKGEVFQPEDQEIELVNAALHLRRPLLITGKPGIGKTTLAYAVAHELKLGKVLRWSITTQTMLKDGLYSYDAVARLQDTSLLKTETGQSTPQPIGKYLRLGPLGTAFADSETHPRVLLIDEIDKSDVDLPNDLLHVFEEGAFEIPELKRLAEDHADIPLHEALKADKPARIGKGVVRCKKHFPLVILTSNGEREFPPAFLRRCLRLEMAWPMGEQAKKDKLARIVRAHLKYAPKFEDKVSVLIDNFLTRRKDDNAELSTDQLLNAVYLVLKNIDPQHSYENKAALLETLWKPLNQ